MTVLQRRAGCSEQAARQDPGRGRIAERFDDVVVGDDIELFLDVAVGVGVLGGRKVTDQRPAGDDGGNPDKRGPQLPAKLQHRSSCFVFALFLFEEILESLEYWHVGIPQLHSNVQCRI